MKFMQPITKIIVFSLFLFPLVVSAEECLLNDPDCKIKQLQLQDIKKSGVKPTEIVQPPATLTPTNGEKSNDTKVIQPKPFKIPLPIILQSKPTTITQQSQQDTTSDLAPSSEDSEKQDNETQASDSTVENQDQQPVPQPTGIQYR